jgi:3-hydroxymyristoyl/3-hydroxydecanoyl-(acyl carrier protein) dehydratase
MPFAVLQEVALQACGWTSAYMGSALASPDDLAFRNLGGEAVALLDVTPETGMLTTRVKVTRVSHSGGMILQHYDFETSARGAPVYRGSTYFGFFRREALADQVGIRDATPYQPGPDERARARAFDYPEREPFPDRQLRMIDRVEAFVADGGPHGLGFIAGTADVDPSAWFFRAHFHQDPVWPGSLGLESLLQLLKVVAVERWGGEAAGLRFEPVGLGETHRWVYRGQVVPADRVVAVQAVVTRVDDVQKLVVADGHLSVGGRVIYRMEGFSIRLG